MNQANKLHGFERANNWSKGHSSTGSRLRRLRLNANLSMRSVAAVALVSQSRLSRIERGLAVPTLGDVLALCAAIGVPDRTKRQLVRQMDQERATVTLGNMRVVPTFYDAWPLKKLESESAQITSVDWQFVPGLLQTAEYAESAIGQSLRLLPANQRSKTARKILDHRLQRQRMLDDLDRQFKFRIHVSTLTSKSVDPDVLIRQLECLCKQLDRPNVSIELIDGPTMEKSVFAPVSAMLLSSCVALELAKRTAVFSDNDTEYSDFVAYFNKPTKDLVASGTRARDFVSSLAGLAGR